MNAAARSVTVSLTLEQAADMYVALLAYGEWCQRQADNSLTDDGREYWARRTQSARATYRAWEGFEWQ